MSILDFFISVNIKNGIVYITGINPKRLVWSIKQVQGDNRFAGQVFTVNKRSLELPEFFLPDFYFIIGKVIENTRHLSYKYTIQKLQEQVIKSTWIGDTLIPHPGRLNLNKLKNIHYTPKDYQEAFLDYYSHTVPMYKLKGALLSATMGSGKTAMGLMVSECLEADKVIIICPLSAVKRVWEQQIIEVFKTLQSYWLSTDDKGYEQQRFAIYHYEALGKLIDDIPKLQSKRTVLILDESHNLNNPKSLRTQLFLEIVNKLQSEDILFSSGTPIKALGQEAVVLFKAIDPLFTEDVQRRFTKLFGEKTSEANIELLKIRLGQVSFKVTKAQVNLGAPNMIPLPVKISNNSPYLLSEVSKTMAAYIEERTDYYNKRYKQDLELYNRLVDFYEETIQFDKTALVQLNYYKNSIQRIQEAHEDRTLHTVTDDMVFCNKFEKENIIPKLLPDDKERFKEVKTLIKYVSLKIQGEALGRVLGRLRVECHKAMVEGIDFQSIIDESLKKTVVFSSYIEVCQEVVDKTISLGYKPVQVFGSSTKHLSGSVDAFMTNDEVNPLVTTYASLSTAVPLIIANTMILINSPFRAYIQEQAIARIHRLGADTPTFVYECYLDTGEQPNLSTRGIDILQWSRDQVLKITGVKSVYEDSGILETNEGLSVANESLGLLSTEAYKYQHGSNVISVLESW